MFSDETMNHLPPNIAVEIYPQGSFPGVETLLPDIQQEYLIVRRLNPAEDGYGDDDSLPEEDQESTQLVDSTDGDMKKQLLNIEDARTVLNIYSLSQTSKKIQSENDGDSSKRSPWELPVRVLCDGQDIDKTYLLGCSVKQDQKDRLEIVSVTCDGPLTDKGAIPSLESLKCSMSSNGMHKITSKGFVKYVVFSLVSLHTTMDDDGLPKSSITMEWEWPRVKELLETPTGQQCTLKIKKGKKEILHTTPERNLKELQLLKSFIAALSTDEISWPSRDENTQSVEEIMKIYLQDLKENPVKYVNEKYVETFEEIGHYEEDVLGRRFLDFTERIWLIIAHNATSYNDVNSVLKLVENEFKTGQLQPMIYPDNTSSIAGKIRDFYLSVETPDQWKTFSLPDESSLELLIGIALDKIRRDFTTYLIDNSLCLGHQISWYVPTKDSKVDIREQAYRLQCLHHVVELALLTSGFLNRFISSNLDVIKTAILHYQSHSPDEEFTIIAPAIPVELKTLCQRSIPVQWQVELKETGPRENTLIVNLTRNPPFSHLGSPQFDTTAVDLQEDEFISYYITKVRQHEVRFL